ncbi:hypothetical protein SAMN05421841_2141 [Chryseobacterium wanjuense]|uniref:Uncharacterized protein n=1 Tax=Chryseobacterium wanjuense TaxID=356305 RepID=A0A1I0QS64_9FLAO|nr:hypothetical protein SAMN05421841_2141 [Chryseobacterium wanjuense]
MSTVREVLVYPNDRETIAHAEARALHILVVFENYQFYSNKKS